MKSLKDGRFEMIMSKRLGSGNFADVYLAKDNQTGQDVAIKVIAMDKIRKYGEKLQKAIEKEVYVLKQLTQYDNPYLLRFIDCFDTANNKYLVLEFCNGGTLGDILKKQGKLSEAKVLEYAYQMVMGLSALEEAGMSHRDLKPDNVFMHNDICKIGDFGFASHESKFTSSLGTCIYMGPEFYVGRGSMNSKVDVWAFGITVHQLLFNNFPYDGNSAQEVIQGVINKIYNVPSDANIGPNTADLIKRCLDKDPNTRISFKELRTHPAFKPFIPVTTNRLGADVKASLFNQPAGLHNMDQRNIYNQLANHLNNAGFTKPEEPKENLVAKKNEFINKTLVDYRNAYMFFVEVSQNLDHLHDTDLCAFFLLKRALQRASILLYYVRDEHQPPQNMLHDTTATDWNNYIQSELFVNFMPYLVYDVVEIRSLFERKFEGLSRLYLAANPAYGAWINDNLEINLREGLNMFIKDTARRHATVTKLGLNTSMMLLIVNEIDTRDSTCQYLDNIREKVERVIQNNDEAKTKIIMTYLSK